MSQEKKILRVGDLLVKADLLTEDLLEERLQVARLLGQPLGQTLERAGDVTRYQLLCAVQLQSLYLDGGITVETAVEVLKVCVSEGCFLEDALKRVGFVDSSAWSAKLGELLSDAGAIDDDQLVEALDLSFREGAPLGQILLRKGLVHPALIAKALFAQKKIRGSELTRDAAVRELQEFCQKPVMASDAD